MAVRVVIGELLTPLMTFTDVNISGCVCSKDMHPIGEELPIGTAEITIKTDGFVDLFCPSDYSEGMEGSDHTAVICRDVDGSYVLDVPINTKVWVSNNNSLVGKYYVKEVTRKSKNEFTVSCVDWTGILDNYKFNGICFYGSNWTLANALQAILIDGYSTAKNGATTNYGAGHPVYDVYSSFVISDDYLATTFSLNNGFVEGGCTLREYLQTILFDCNIMAKHDYNGDIVLSAYPATVGTTVQRRNTYEGSTREQNEKVDSISVTEHTYATDSSATFEVVYDTTETGTSDDFSTIYLEEPASTFTTSGNFTYSNMFNHAFICVKGYGSVSVKKYAHTTRVISDRKVALSSAVGGADVAVDNCCITAANSEILMNKLKNYYYNEPFKNTISSVSEHAYGTNVNFTDAIGDTTNGFIASKAVEISGTTKTTMNIYSGYTPTSSFGYSNSVVLTGSGTFNVPQSVLSSTSPRIKVILIGGGQGGANGCRGMDGVPAFKTNSQFCPDCYAGYSRTDENGFPIVDRAIFLKPSAGGVRGVSGRSGKIYSQTIYNPSATYSYSCGEGGTGASGGNTSTTISTEGSYGTSTTFGSYSSASGDYDDYGFEDPITGAVYAIGRGYLDEYLCENKIYSVNTYLRSRGKADMVGAGAFYSFGDDRFGSRFETYDEDGEVITTASQKAFSMKNSDIGPTALSYRGFSDWGDDYYNSSITKINKGGGGGGSGIDHIGSNGSNATSSKTGNGGNGGDSTYEPPKVTYLKSNLLGSGGLGGFGGGGGGAAGPAYPASSTATLGTPGTGGVGGPGGDGSDGCVIVLY